MKDDSDFSRKYCTNYLKEEDELLFEIGYVTDRFNKLTIFPRIILAMLTDGILGPREHQYIFGVGKFNIYILYLGKYYTIPSEYEFKPKYVKIISLNSIRDIDIKRLIGLLYKLSIFTNEGNLVIFVPLNKPDIDNLKNILLKLHYPSNL
jgi:hypothetical protein